MNEKVLHTLEYHKILEQLASYASCEEVKKRCLALHPISDIAEIEDLQKTTADALTRLYRSSSISFVGMHDPDVSIKRLEIGASLNAA